MAGQRQIGRLANHPGPKHLPVGNIGSDVDAGAFDPGVTRHGELAQAGTVARCGSRQQVTCADDRPSPELVASLALQRAHTGGVT